MKGKIKTIERHTALECEIHRCRSAAVAMATCREDGGWRVEMCWRHVGDELVQLISLSHFNRLPPFFLLLSLLPSLLCTLTLSLHLIHSLRLINSQVCLQWVKHEVCVCVCVFSLWATPPLLPLLNHFTGGFSFGQPAPRAKCGAYSSKDPLMQTHARKTPLSLSTADFH